MNGLRGNRIFSTMYCTVCAENVAKICEGAQNIQASAQDRPGQKQTSITSTTKTTKHLKQHLLGSVLGRSFAKPQLRTSFGPGATTPTANINNNSNNKTPGTTSSGLGLGPKLCERMHLFNVFRFTITCQWRDERDFLSIDHRYKPPRAVVACRALPQRESTCSINNTK